MFEYMQGLKVKADDTAEITLYDITLPNGEHPVLIGRMAGEVNRPYFNALLNINLTRNNQAKKNLTVEMIDENRRDDLDLFPEHVLTGWRNVTDSSGKAVEFTKEHAKEFLSVLPTHILDQVRTYFSNADNFMGDLATPEEVDTTGN